MIPHWFGGRLLRSTRLVRPRAPRGTRDIGADEVENAANFLTDVEIDEDLVTWKLPMLVFVLVQAEPDAIGSAAETIRRFRKAVPSAHLVLVENLLERKALDQLS